MGTELATLDAYNRASLDERRQYVMAIAQAGELLPRTLWHQVRNADGQVTSQPSPGKVLLLAETGAMLGIHPMAALQGVHIIEGRPTLSANLMASLVRRAGHRLRVKLEGTGNARRAVATLVRADDPDFEFKVEWTLERAKTAGLIKPNGNWEKYPEAMLKARAISEVIREGAPDALMGALYTPEELGATVDADGEPVELRQVQNEPAASAAAPAPAAAPAAAPEAPSDEALQRWLAWKELIDAAPDRVALTALYQQARPIVNNVIPGDPDGRKVGDYFREIGEQLPDSVDDQTGEVTDAEAQDAPVTGWETRQPPADPEPAAEADTGDDGAAEAAAGDDSEVPF